MRTYGLSEAISGCAAASTPARSACCLSSGGWISAFQSFVSAFAEFVEGSPPSICPFWYWFPANYGTLYWSHSYYTATGPPRSLTARRRCFCFQRIYALEPSKLPSPFVRLRALGGAWSFLRTRVTSWAFWNFAWATSSCAYSAYSVFLKSCWRNLIWSDFALAFLPSSCSFWRPHWRDYPANPWSAAWCEMSPGLFSFR